MARRFRFRIREGGHLHRAVEGRVTTYYAGYEFVLSEQDAARLLRDRGNRDAYELIDVEDEEATPPAGRPAHD